MHTTTPRPRRPIRHPIEALERRRLLSAAMVAVPALTASPAFATGSSTAVGYTPTQVRAAYGISSTSFGSTTGNGTGQTIAIVTAYSNPAFVGTASSAFLSSDLAEFDDNFGLPNPPSMAVVGQDGTTTDLPATDPTGGGWADETALDVEWAHAAAPGANLLLVECNSGNLSDLIGGGVNTARAYPGVSVVSMSFASPEAATETQYDPDFATPAGHVPVTFVAAAGDDSGVAEYPSASPDVVSVGGAVATFSGDSLASETALSTAGGGASAYEPKPVYQYGVTQSATHRTTPDVSFAANDTTDGFAVYDSENGGSFAPFYAVGGTSYATAVWAGLVAVADQGRALEGLPSMDSASQTLPRLYYLNQTDFTDVTTGSNGNPALVGYDLATGRGTPIANQLVPDLAGGASISGTEFQDTNRNGAIDAGDTGIPNAGVYLDLYHTGTVVGADPVVTTNALGQYRFGDLPGGTYRLSSVGLTSYTKTTAPYVTITVGYGTAVTNQNIGEHLDTGSIAGKIFIDANDNRMYDPGEAGLAGQVVYLDTNDNGVQDPGEPSTTSASDGSYSFTGLLLGRDYYVRQTIPTGYSRTTLAAGAAVTVPLFGGTYTVNIGYVPDTASISGTVFSDTNGNGVQNAGEPGLAGWGVYLDLNRDGSYTPGVDLRVFTDANGHYTISGLAPGTYVLNESVVTGYTRTAVSTAGYTVVVSVGSPLAGYNFGNEPT